jgi:hypothetical protein
MKRGGIPYLSVKIEMRRLFLMNLFQLITMSQYRKLKVGEMWGLHDGDYGTAVTWIVIQYSLVERYRFVGSCWLLRYSDFEATGCL